MPPGTSSFRIQSALAPEGRKSSPRREVPRSSCSIAGSCLVAWCRYRLRWCTRSGFVREIDWLKVRMTEKCTDSRPLHCSYGRAEIRPSFIKIKTGPPDDAFAAAFLLTQSLSQFCLTMTSGIDSSAPCLESTCEGFDEWWRLRRGSFARRETGLLTSTLGYQR